MKPLEILIEIDPLQVTVTACGADGETMVLPNIGPGVLEASGQLCALLEPPGGDERVLQAAIRDLSRVLLQPLAAAIHAAREVVVSIPKGALDIPLDLLTHERQPLFLAKPVSYRIGPTSELPEPALVGPSAYTLSDITSDPDRGCLSVARGFGRVTFQDEQDSSPELVRQLQARDVVVFSLHGVVGSDAGDSMFTTAGPIRPEDLSSLRPRLIYLDSCRLGVSRAFLEHLRRTGTRYYLAPIIKNEAGESSTQTMQLFFQHLLSGQTPEQALFLTRQALWRLYASDDLRQRLWRTFPFRVYRLH